MEPAFVVRFRPAGPWRIGPDSGARNRVDRTYHSDTLYSAVTNAMAQLGRLEDWLRATAATADGPAVRFSSMFPYLDDILFVPPPRHLWPPAPSAKVRWKSARFVPLNAVSLLLNERTLDENRWSVDGPSECLIPSSRNAGPFRESVRTHSAVDRVTGRSETRRTACLEFAPGAGLWAVVSFADEAAKDKWAGPVKAALRLLADTGFGGERSLGWGHADQPQFRDGVLPDLIYKPQATRNSQKPSEPKPGDSQVQGAAAQAPAESAAAVETPAPEPGAEASAAPQEPAATATPEEASAVEPGTEASAAPQEPAAAATPEEASAVEPGTEASLASQEPAATAAPEEASPEPAAGNESPAPELAPAVPEPGPREAAIRNGAETAALQAPTQREAPHKQPETAYWLLSLFAPAEGESVDWARGAYAVLTRGGRVQRSGEEKKLLRMVEEGSVILSPAPPRGAAPDVAPEGCAHPVFRAGFAVAIPITLRAQERPAVAP